jgi:hypothetical protein
MRASDGPGTLETAQGSSPTQRAARQEISDPHNSNNGNAKNKRV